jgi:hypothetical protein
MTSIIFEFVLIKINDLKIKAPRLEIHNGCEKWSICNAYSSLLRSFIDYISLETDIKNYSFSNAKNMIVSSPWYSNSDIPYSKTPLIENAFRMIDSLSSDITNIIISYCDILLDNNYLINPSLDKNKLHIYIVYKFIPIYFEILFGCYNIFNLQKRIELMIKFNEFFSSFPHNKITIDGNSNIFGIICMLKEAKLDFKIFEYINEIYNEMEKKINYIQNNKYDTKVVSEIPVIQEKSEPNIKISVPKEKKIKSNTNVSVNITPSNVTNITVNLNDKINFNDLTVAGLKKYCKDNNIYIASGLRKDEIIEKINNSIIIKPIIEKTTIFSIEK